MALAYAIVHKSIGQDVVNALDYPTGEQITVPMRDPIYETRDVLDEDGNPTGETYDVFIGWGEVYDLTVDERSGGYVLIGRIGNWFLPLLSSSKTRLAAIANNAGDNLIPLVIIDYDDEGNTQLDVRISTQNISRINTWLENNGYPTIPGTWTYKRVVIELLKFFAVSGNFEDYSVKGSPDV